MQYILWSYHHNVSNNLLYNSDWHQPYKESRENNGNLSLVISVDIHCFKKFSFDI